MKDSAVLTAIKVLHTVVWLFFAVCILSMAISGATKRFHVAIVCILIVLLECLVLAFNRAECPLTKAARRYTADPAENLDIYLPLWLARHNQLIFGTLYAAASLFVVLR